MKQIFRSSVIILFVLFYYHTSRAVLTTHNWLENHRGYSIELVPGTGGTTGIAAEYVAAGTVYNGGNQPAWHFMHLDANGTVMDERTAIAGVDLLHEFRVVDIACESDNKFWITIQARNATITPQDYIYIAGVDITGADLPLNPAIAIASNNNYKNLYPTHSFFATANGFLYICGYATPDTEYPQWPHEHTSDKIGMFLKVDVNGASPAVPNSYFWNTPSSGGTFNSPDFDYDMALKIAPYNHAQTFPLLVTGAANDGLGNPYNISNAFAASFGVNANPINISSLFPSPYGYSTLQGFARGMYGIDIRGGVYGGSDGGVLNPDIIVLVNFIEPAVILGEPTPPRAYGIARIKNDLTERAVGASIKYTTGLMHAKQFLELHGNSTQSSVNNHIYIVGETEELPGNCADPDNLPLGAQLPSSMNFNPFISFLLFGNGEYSYSTGFNTSSATPINTKIYLSSQSTTAANMDYPNGTFAGTPENITRLYTFASLERHYDDPTVSNPPVSEPAMVLPIADNTSPDLKTKFLGLTAPLYDETVCEKHVEDCTNTYYMEIDTKTDHFSQVENPGLSVGSAYSIFTLTNNSYIPTNTDCDDGQGIYKPGRTTGIEDAAGNTAFEVYPNPAHKTLNIKFGTAQGKYSVLLTDALGKVVLQQDGKAVDKLTLSLPGLSPGMYMVTIVTEKATQTSKITIQ